MKKSHVPDKERETSSFNFNVFSNYQVLYLSHYGCGGDFCPLHRRALPASAGQGNAVIPMISSKNKAKHDDDIVLFYCSFSFH